MTRRRKPGRCGATVASLAAFAITVAYAPALATGGGAAEAPPEVPAAAEVAKRDAEVLKRPIGPDQSKSPKPDEQPPGGDGAGSGAPTDPPAEPSPPDQPKAPGASAGGPSGKPPGHSVPSPGHGGPRPGNGEGPPATPPGHAKPDPPGAGNPGQNEPGSSPGQGRPGTGGGDPGQGKNVTGSQPEPQPEPQPGDGQGKDPTGGQDGSPTDEGQGKAPSGGRPQSGKPPARADRGSGSSQRRNRPSPAAEPSASTEAEGSTAPAATARGAGDEASTPPDGAAGTRSATAPAEPAEPAADPVDQSGSPAPQGDDAGNGQPQRNRQAGTEAAPTAERKSGGVVFVSGVPTEVLLGLVAFALTAAGLAIGLLREHRRYREVEQDALTDPVTGLANRIAFEHQLALDWHRALRYERPLGVLLIDLDDFKRTNDTRGHVAGDRVLRETAETIAREVRGGDVAARLGGDEFVVLAAETPTDGLEILARRLRGALAERGIAASVGCAERTVDDGAAAQVLDRADHAMYEDKERRKSAGTAAEAARR